MATAKSIATLARPPAGGSNPSSAAVLAETSERLAALQDTMKIAFDLACNTNDDGYLVSLLSICRRELGAIRDWVEEHDDVEHAQGGAA